MNRKEMADELVRVVSGFAEFLSKDDMYRISTIMVNAAERVIINGEIPNEEWDFEWDGSNYKSKNLGDVPKK